MTADGVIIGYTAGGFDVFHIGHLNLLKAAAARCDYLIVGVTTDELIYQTKHEHTIANLSERMEILRSIKYVDRVVVQDDLDKVEAWHRIHYNVLFSGDDWKNTPRWQGYERELTSLGAEVVYFPYTRSVSSSRLRRYIEQKTQS